MDISTLPVGTCVKLRSGVITKIAAHQHNNGIVELADKTFRDALTGKLGNYQWGSEDDVVSVIPEDTAAAPLNSETLALPEMPYQNETAVAHTQMIENLWAYLSKCQLEVEKSLKALEDLDQKVQVHHCRLSIAKVHLTHATEPGSTECPQYSYQRPTGPDVLPDGWSRDGQELHARSDHPAVGREF